MSILQQTVLSVLPHVPRPIMRRLSARYIAGERLEEALARLADLARDGHPGILDLLGEGVRDEAGARAAHADYVRASDALASAGRDAYVSVKPTHFGLEHSEDLALELYHALAAHAAGHGQFMRVEMEDSPTTDATLRIYEALREKHDNVGVVLQSRLLRTPADIDRLAPGPLSVRMVKGIYLEPAEVAHTEPGPISEAYLACCEQLLDRGAFVSFATHDEQLAERLLEMVRRRGLAPDAFEFQVLLGVQQQLWKRWRDAGYAVRVYVPYGPDWLAYSLRRLKYNPQILGHVMRATLRLG